MKGSESHYKPACCPFNQLQSLHVTALGALNVTCLGKNELHSGQCYVSHLPVIQNYAVLGLFPKNWMAYCIVGVICVDISCPLSVLGLRVQWQ